MIAVSLVAVVLAFGLSFGRFRYWALGFNLIPLCCLLYVSSIANRLASNEDTDQAAMGPLFYAGTLLLIFISGLIATALGWLIATFVRRRAIARETNFLGQYR